jgi:hypothetical protein
MSLPLIATPTFRLVSEDISESYRWSESLSILERTESVSTQPDKDKSEKIDTDSPKNLDRKQPFASTRTCPCHTRGRLPNSERSPLFCVLPGLRELGVLVVGEPAGHGLEFEDRLEDGALQDEKRDSG